MQQSILDMMNLMLSHTRVWKPLNKNKLDSNQENQKVPKENQRVPKEKILSKTKTSKMFDFLHFGQFCLNIHTGLSMFQTKRRQGLCNINGTYIIYYPTI